LDRGESWEAEHRTPFGGREKKENFHFSQKGYTSRSKLDFSNLSGGKKHILKKIQK